MPLRFNKKTSVPKSASSNEEDNKSAPPKRTVIPLSREALAAIRVNFAQDEDQDHYERFDY